MTGTARSRAFGRGPRSSILGLLKAKPPRSYWVLSGRGRTKIVFDGRPDVECRDVRDRPGCSRERGCSGDERNADLLVAGVYRRDVAASLERVWENVHDWEHLPWLHRESFTSIERIASGEWGWRAQVGLAGGAMARIELVTDPEQCRYVARTIEGAGAPSEIWTSLDPIAQNRTSIEVEFCVSPLPEPTLRRLGEGYVDLYTLLWDQDEGMMQTRESALDARRTLRSSPEASPPPLDLGNVDAIRERLPLVIEFGGASFRLVPLGDEVFAHSVQCPHRLGPLDGCEVEGSEIVCPWHGYRFDFRTGLSCDENALRLRPAPRLEVDAATRHLIVHPPDLSRRTV